MCQPLPVAAGDDADPSAGGTGALHRLWLRMRDARKASRASRDRALVQRNDGTYGISWNILEYRGISWNIMEYRGISWNIMELL